MNKQQGYIKKEERKKILLLCDDIRAHSGVAHMGREIIINTSHRYNWVNLGGAVKHPDEGKKFDLSADISKQNNISDASVIIHPISGYGTPDLLRSIIKQEKIDAIFIITDPRYWTWLFEMEAELRKKTPIVYLNIWDNYPAPIYNKTFYESCDALLGISKQTVNINKLVLGDKAEGKIIEYVPHGIDPKIFRPLELDKVNKDYVDFETKMKQDKDINFTVLFNSRNIRRKQIPDTILAFKYFADTLSQEDREKTLLLLHTQPVDNNGTDLNAVIDLLAPSEQGYNIHFTGGQLSPQEMNYLYNIADATILLSSNEGWGLALTESLLTATPFVANVTGGMQDQMRFVDDNSDWFTPDAKVPSNHNKTYTSHGEWAFPVYPSNKSIVGSPVTPYIWDDRCTPEDAAKQLGELYNLSSEQRIERGRKGLEWATGTEAGFTSKIMGERVIENIDTLFKTWKPRKKYELILAGKQEKKVVNHELVY